MVKIEPNVIVNGVKYNYHVTKDGRVFSLKYENPKEINPMKDYKGYNIISLWDSGKNKKVRVARLVALAYIPNIHNKPEVDHINRVRSDDRVENLRWVTRTENTKNRDAKNNKKMSKPVRCIETGVIYPSVRETERQLGYLSCSISSCCRGKLKTAYGFHWEYVE